MKIISLKKPWLSAAIFVLAISSLSSCLKDTGPVQDFSKSPALVSFQYTGSASQDMVTSILPGTDDSVGIEITISTHSGTLSSPVTVTLALDPDSLATYNAANGTTYTMLDPADYTTPANMQLTIAPGKQIVPFVLHINESLIDFSTTPILIFKIASASGATIATNLSVIVLPIKLRNPYEGSYTVTGYFVHPAAPRAINLTKSLATISAIRSEGFVGDLGSKFQFDVSPTNTLINWASAVNASSGFINGTDNLANDPNYPGAPYVYTTYNNTYDPVAKTFWMHYGYNGGPAYSREIYEKWVHQ
jgi:Domain of unknown function (DUF1735)